MTGPGARAIATAVAVAALATACSGSDQPEVQPPLESAEPPPSSPPSTEPSDTTTPDSTTADTTTTSPVETTTSATTTTEPAPTTTTLEDLRLEIEADLNEGEQAFLAAAADPSSAESRELASQYQSGEALDRVLALLAEYAANGEVLRPSSEIPNRIEVMSVDPETLDSTSAVICRIDAAVKLIPAAPGREEQIVDDRFGRFITAVDLRLIDGRWLIDRGDTTSLDVGVSSCEG